MAIVKIFEDATNAALVDINGALLPKGFHINNPQGDLIYIQSFKLVSRTINQGVYEFKFQNLRDGTDQSFPDLDSAIDYLKSILI